VAIGTISAKGQITIPVSVRKKMALKSGDKVLFEEKPEGFSITKINDDLVLRYPAKKNGSLWKSASQAMPRVKNSDKNRFC